MATTKSEDLSNLSTSNEDKSSSSINLSKRNIKATTTTASSSSVLLSTSSSDPCHHCQKRVYITERIGPIKESFYHKFCFKCSECNQRLDFKTYCTNSFDLNDTKIYCQKHAPRSIHQFSGLLPVCTILIFLISYRYQY